MVGVAKIRKSQNRHRNGDQSEQEQFSRSNGKMSHKRKSKKSHNQIYMHYRINFSQSKIRTSLIQAKMQEDIKIR